MINSIRETPVKVTAGAIALGDYTMLTHNVGRASADVTILKGIQNKDLISLRWDADFIVEVTEENRAKYGYKIAAGALGAILLGPIGLLIGALGAGSSKVIHLAVSLKDGRGFTVEVEPKEWALIRLICKDQILT